MRLEDPKETLRSTNYAELLRFPYRITRGTAGILIQTNWLQSSFIGASKLFQTNFKLSWAALQNFEGPGHGDDMKPWEMEAVGTGIRVTSKPAKLGILWPPYYDARI